MTNNVETLNREVLNPDVVVVGGGLAGLTAAALVARAGKTVVVHEKRGVVGGDARSTTKEGFTFNLGPHALYPGGPAERVLGLLGVTTRGGQPPIKGRLVFADRAEIAPAGPATLLRTRALKPKEKIEVGRLLARIPNLNPSKFAALTVDDWIAQTVRSERTAELVRALVRLSTYANQPDLLSADLAVVQLQRALGGVTYLDNGWQSLVDQLQAKPGVHVVIDAVIDQLPDAPAVIVAAGGPAVASALLEKTFAVGPPATTSCLDLGLRRRPDEDVVIGGDVPFYFSNHSAVADLAPAGRWHAAAVQYLAEGDDPDPAAIEAFTRHAGVREDDVVTQRRLHRMTAVTAIPTADLGGLTERPRATDTGHRQVFIAGDWVGPIGYLADAVIASAESAANAAILAVEKRRVG